MARQEQDREDLMREATALVERAEFRIASEPQTVIAGFRRDGSTSIYFGADPCVHFDSQLRLRRAFIDGDLYRTQSETLARLVRSRTETSVELHRHDLSPDQLTSLLDDVSRRLQRLLNSLATTSDCVQTVPADADLRPRLMASLQRITSQPIVLAPAIRGKH